MQTQSNQQQMILAAAPSTVASGRAAEIAERLSRETAFKVAVLGRADPLRALVSGRADAALFHSPDRRDRRHCTVLAATVGREVPAGVIVARVGKLDVQPTRPLGLDPPAEIMTESRLAAGQLRAVADVTVTVSRGKADSMMRRLSGGHCDAIVVDPARLRRLPDPAVFEIARIPPDILLPPLGEGGLILACRPGDPNIPGYRRLEDPVASRCLECEDRLARLFSDRSLVGGLATPEADGAIRLRAVLVDRHRGGEPARTTRISAVGKDVDRVVTACRDALTTR